MHDWDLMMQGVAFLGWQSKGFPVELAVERKRVCSFVYLYWYLFTWCFDFSPPLLTISGSSWLLLVLMWSSGRNTNCRWWYRPLQNGQLQIYKLQASTSFLSPSRVTNSNDITVFWNLRSPFVWAHVSTTSCWFMPRRRNEEITQGVSFVTTLSIQAARWQNPQWLQTHKKLVCSLPSTRRAFQLGWSNTTRRWK